MLAGQHTAPKPASAKFFLHRRTSGQMTALQAAPRLGFRGLAENVAPGAPFTGKELDEETGLYYFGARYYDPRTSVWQSTDPILGKYLPNAPHKEDENVKLLPPTVQQSLAQFNLPGMGGVFNPTNLAMYTYAGQNPLRYVDPDGNELVNSYFFTNSKVSSNLVALNKAVIQVTGKKDSEFKLVVTGGDRYLDSHGVARSLTTGKVVAESVKKSPHLIESGARAADISISGITKADLKKAVALTEFSSIPGNYKDDYDDNHIHVGLSKADKNNASGLGKLVGEVIKSMRNTEQVAKEALKNKAD